MNEQSHPSLQEQSKPIVGAIRWDAWSGGDVTAQVERSLAPEKYRHRLPWFAEVLGNGKVRIDGSPQAIMDQEIDFAADAGLDYWAFLLYAEEDSMSTALARYLRSARRGRINFCLILHNAFGVSEERWPAERDRAVALLSQPANVPYVPLVTTGWDKHPRKDNPVSWELNNAYHTQNVFPSMATPDEIASHLGHALAFVRKHPEICPARAVVVYAWNEHDEGGWLSPTWTRTGTPDTSRLDAIRGVLRT